MKGDLELAVNRASGSAWKAYEFAPGSYTWSAIAAAEQIRRVLISAPDWIMEFLDYDEPTFP